MSIINNKTDETPLNGIYKNLETGDVFKFTVKFYHERMLTQIKINIISENKEINEKKYEARIYHSSIRVFTTIQDNSVYNSSNNYYNKPQLIMDNLKKGLFSIIIENNYTSLEFTKLPLKISLNEDNSSCGIL